MSAPPSPASEVLADATGSRIWPSLLSAALGVFAFFLPFSSAGVSLALGALIALAAVRPRAIRGSQPWKEPAMAAGLALLAYIAAHTLWTSGLSMTTLHTVNHYNELLLAPLVLALLQGARQRRVFINGLIAGGVLLALAHWASLVVPSLAAMLSSRRISAGFALAVCAFIVLLRARGKPHPWPARALAAFLASTVVFAIDGRTGQIVLLVVASCAAWLHSPPRRRWLAAVIAPLLVLTLAMSSNTMSGRIAEMLDGTPAGTVAASSTAIRIELLRVATDLVRRHGATGAGFANYSVVHEQAARARYGADPATAANLQAHWIRSTNPHSEYLMQWISGGVASLALFLAWLGLTLRQGLQARAPAGGMLVGVTLAFAVACLFNSLLLDFVEGHFYVGLMAWLLAESRAARREQDSGCGMQRVLVISTRQIGDVLLTTPLIRVARERWPRARIEVLGFAGTLGMLRGNPDVDELIETPARPGWNGWRALVWQLWHQYDLALVTDPGDRAHLMGWVAAPCRSGIVPLGGGSNWWKKLLLDHVVVAAGDRGSVHVTAEKISLLAPWLDAAASTVPQVMPPQGAPLPGEVQAGLLPGAVVLHAPSMWTYKQWPIAHFEKLIEALLAQGLQVVLTGSSGARDQECIAPLRTLAKPPQLLDLSGQLDFNQLVTLLRGAALYIGPDTSVSHLAAATGVPVIAIFGPTNPMRWAPWPARAQARELFARSTVVQQAGNVTVLQSSLSCVPCGRAGCEDHRHSRSDCLIDITPERVLEEALKVLEVANLCPPPSGEGWGRGTCATAPIPAFPQRGKA
jgi:ADP-heptose:LPS heptosyltransferase/O-antigen ligase